MSSEEPEEGADPNGGKVTAETYGSTHLENVGNDCWLLRLPPKLAKAWEKVPEGSTLGELVFTKGGRKPGVPGGMSNPASVIKPSLDIKVAEELGADDTTLPLQYTLSAMTKKVPTMHPFVRHPNGSVTMQGTVSRTANLQVHQINDSRYRQLSKNRILQSAVNANRYVKPVEANQVVQQSRSKQRTSGAAGGGGGRGGGFGEAVHQYGKRLLEAAANGAAAAAAGDANKRQKFSEDQTTKSVVFQLFSQQPYWTVKDLKHASGGRPEAEIRDVLREIGDYHRSGDHKNTWELRKEFQVQQQAGGSES